MIGTDTSITQETASFDIVTTPFAENIYSISDSSGNLLYSSFDKELVDNMLYEISKSGHFETPDYSSCLLVFDESRDNIIYLSSKDADHMRDLCINNYFWSEYLQEDYNASQISIRIRTSPLYDMEDSIDPPGMISGIQYHFRNHSIDLRVPDNGHAEHGLEVMYWTDFESGIPKINDEQLTYFGDQLTAYSQDAYEFKEILAEADMISKNFDDLAVNKVILEISDTDPDFDQNAAMDIKLALRERLDDMDIIYDETDTKIMVSNSDIQLAQSFYREIQNSIKNREPQEQHNDNISKAFEKEALELTGQSIGKSAVADSSKKEACSKEDQKKDHPKQERITCPSGKIHVETRSKTYNTDYIYLNNKPSQKGLYFINDAKNKAIYGNENPEIVKQVFEYAKAKVEHGDPILTKDLKKQEYVIINSRENDGSKENVLEKSETKDASAEQSEENNWDFIKKNLERQLRLQQKAEKERKKVLAEIDTMEANGAPDNVIDLAKKIVLSREILDNDVDTKNKDSQAIGENLKEQQNGTSYITYRLENKLLTRANASFKAGLVSAYDKLMTPLRRLHEKSLENEIDNRTIALRKLQHKLQNYEKKLEKKLASRLEKTNKTRIRRGLQPFPSNMALYTPKEQERINSMTLMISASENGINSLNRQLDESKNKHNERIQFIKDHKAIAHNEKILDNHKKVFYQHDAVVIKDTETTPSDPKAVETTVADHTDSGSELPHPSAANPIVLPLPEVKETEQTQDTIPVYAPDGTYLGEQDLQENVETDSIPMEESDPYNIKETSVFSPIEDRFAAAKSESSDDKASRNAGYVYFAMESKLPINGYMEFEVNGNSFTACKDEVGELTIKKYNVETAREEPLTKDKAIDIFKEDPKAYEEAVREQLGKILIGRTNNIDQVDIDHHS